LIKENLQLDPMISQARSLCVFLPLYEGEGFFFFFLCEKENDFPSLQANF